MARVKGLERPTQAFVSVGAGQAIEGDWRTVNGKTVTLQQRSVIVFRLQ
jgi:hypothetical protein